MLSLCVVVCGIWWKKRWECLSEAAGCGLATYDKGCKCFCTCERSDGNLTGEPAVEKHSASTAGVSATPKKAARPSSGAAL